MIQSIKVSEFINSKFCVSTEAGELIYNTLERNIENKQCTILSFSDIELITPVFFNMAIGRLYGKFTDEIIEEHLQINDLTEEGRRLLSYQIKKAKKFFSDPDSYKELIKRCYEDDREW